MSTPSDTSVYKEIVEKLDLHKDRFLQNHIDTIRKRLKAASSLFSAKTPDTFSQGSVFGMNQCIHLAGQVAYLGATPSNLSIALKLAKDRTSSDRDSSTLLTMATLFYLLHDFKNELINDCKELDKLSDEDLREINARFTDANWMMAPDDVNRLGLIEER